MRIRVISLDLDGTLIDKGSFDDLFWYQEVPALYAKQHGISFEKAKGFVASEYDKVGSGDPNWYRPGFWFERFRLDYDYNKVIMDLALGISIFPEVRAVLKELMKSYQLVVVSHNPHEFLKLKMRAEGMDMYFLKIFSIVDDFNTVKKHEKVFLEVAERLGVLPGEILHIGDDHDFDYLAPKRAGLKSLFLDRSGKDTQRETIHTLEGIKEFLEVM